MRPSLQHYSDGMMSRAIARAAHDRDMATALWIPDALPEHLHTLALATDMLRRECDAALPGNGAGACLPASAVLGHFALRTGVEARLVCGTFEGAPHWWVSAGGFIFDSTGGQFDVDLPSVAQDDAPGYVADGDYPCGHVNIELLYAEARRAFTDPWQASMFIDMALGVVAEAEMSVSR